MQVGAFIAPANIVGLADLAALEHQGQGRRVILDEGWMEAWEQDGRTHVKSFKKVQFEGAASTWVSAMILEMTELNSEMGELACCERDPSS